MDFITHGLISYLIGSGFGLQYAFFGIIMGVFPDFDVFLYPFYHIFKKEALIHRGGVHSLLVLGSANLIGAFIVNFFIPGSVLLYFFIGFLCSGTHLICDILTLTHIKPFWPFSGRQYKYDIAPSINPIAIFLSMGAGSLLWNMYKAEDSNLAVYSSFIAIIVCAMLGIRIIIKFYLSKQFPTAANYRILPTVTPFFWKIVQKTCETQEITIRFSKYNLFNPKQPIFRVFRFGMVPPNQPITEDAAALSFSYQLPEVKDYLKRSGVHLYCLSKPKNQEAEWVIHWFAAEFLLFDLTLGLKVNLGRSGEYTTRPSFVRLRYCNQKG